MDNSYRRRQEREIMRLRAKAALPEHSFHAQRLLMKAKNIEVILEKAGWA
jgi:hypothetical protein